MWNCFHNLVKSLILLNTLPLQGKCDYCQDKKKTNNFIINLTHLSKKKKSIFCILAQSRKCTCHLSFLYTPKSIFFQAGQGDAEDQPQGWGFPFLQALLIHPSMLNLPSLSFSNDSVPSIQQPFDCPVYQTMRNFSIPHKLL